MLWARLPGRALIERPVNQRLSSSAARHPSSAAIRVTPLGHRFRAVAHPKFQENPVLQLVNHRETQAEFIGDFFVKQSLLQTTHHVMFSVGQARKLSSC